MGSEIRGDLLQALSLVISCPTSISKTKETGSLQLRPLKEFQATGLRVVVFSDLASAAGAATDPHPAQCPTQPAS